MAWLCWSACWSGRRPPRPQPWSPWPPRRRRAARASTEAELPALRGAAAALDALLSPEGGRCAALVAALVSKYLALSPEEVAEWEADPEG